MDPLSLRKRLDTIASRTDELSSSSGYPMGFNLKTYLESSYYRDALLDKHPFVLPSKNDSEYRDRRDYFAQSHPTVEEEYADVINRSESNGQRWYTPFNTRIGIIADEFLYKSFVSTAEFIALTPENYHEHVDSIDLLLVTTTWRGLNGEWHGASLPKHRVRRMIENEIIPLFQEHGVTVAFYSKEDPPNYKQFLSIAKKCDYVFTSASEMIPEYSKSCPNAKAIEALPFSIDHSVHNPVGSRRNRIKDVIFAGSWHNHKYAHRRTAGARLFEGVMNTDRPLRIVDRNWDLDNERYVFPEHYLPYLRPAIAHNELMQIQRTSDIAINLNSVVTSSTMYANRVVELQAMGCSVLSNYNMGVNDQFPNVYIPDSSFDASDIIGSLDDEHLYRNQMAGVRHVYTDYVNFDRIHFLLSRCALIADASQTRSIAVIADYTTALEFIQSQTFDGKIQIVQDEETACSKGIDLACVVSPDYKYGQYYLQDLVNATKFVANDVVFKAPANVDLTLHHDYTAADLPAHGYLRWLGSENSAATLSGEHYQMDHFGVNLKDAGSDQTVNVEVTDEAQPVLSVVVPIYNNGKHLEFKCFESLRRSSIFEQMEILLIDDGSTDASTLAVVKDLEERYTNVKSHFCEAGGSGSASRPRNIGLEMAKAPWITYLDPDNEALNDGFAKLLKMAVENQSDFALGNMVKYKFGRKMVNYVGQIRKHVIDQEVSDSTYQIDSTLLPKINFTPMSIQALVANTSWLRSLGIEQPVGAVGQDSYFFQQMLYYARRISLLNEPIHAYFAAVANSTVNTLGTKFYKKYLPLERARSTWLREIGLLETYKERRMEGFAKGWYVQKLSMVAPEELEESKRLIVELSRFYGEHEWADPELQEFFASIPDEPQSD